jgi:chorismate mutase-like protein
MEAPASRSTARRARALAIAILTSLAALGAAAGTASAAAPAPLEAAREALVLSNTRLELMDEVMASKWFSRSPIQDTAQEASVKEAAAGEAGELGVAAAGTRALFAAEIEAAKEVQLGWGSHWLYYGAPADLAAPELVQLRSQLGEISKQIIAVLPRLVSLSKLPDARKRVGMAAAKILRVRYLGAEGRAALVDALFGLRRAQQQT